MSACRAAVTFPVCRVSASGLLTTAPDLLAAEEPLEIRLGYEEVGRRSHRAISVTMRTPGHDAELAVGFLFTEGIITAPGQVAGVHACSRAGNVVRIDLRPGCAIDFARLERHSYTGSNCGVCGKTSVAAIRVAAGQRPAPGRPVVGAELIRSLPGRLRSGHPGFDATGGLHAAGLFGPAGDLRCVREDVGRHNALDKLIGRQFLDGRVPLSDTVLLVSGRASFELVQKAAVAGIPVLVAVGAPSSLAAELAGERGLTLVGFAREGRFNIYAGAERIAVGPAAPAALAASRFPLPAL